MKSLSYLKDYKVQSILAPLFKLLEASFELLVPLVVADIIDNGINSGDKAYIFQRGALMAFCALAALAIGIASARFSALCGQGLGAELRKAEYQKLQEFSFGNMDHFRVSSLITRLTGDVTTIQNSVSTGMRPACRAPFMMVLALGLSFFINRSLAVVFFVALPVLAVLLFQIIRHVRPLYEKMQGAMDLVNRIVQENLTAVRVVKS